MVRRAPFTAQREHHQEFAAIVSEYTLTGGPLAQADAAWQFQCDAVSVPEDWKDQQGYVIDAPSVIHTGSVRCSGNFQDFAYYVR